MKCIILAAGYATRLYPLTENYPKPLLEVNNKKILDYLIEDLSSKKYIDEFIVVSNHKFIDIFESWKKTRGEKITIVDDGTTTNDNRLGAVIDIKFAIEKLHIDDDVFIIAGDNLLDFSLNYFIEFAKEKNTSCVMCDYVEDLNRLKKMGVLELNEQNQVIDMEEKPENPKTHLSCPPFYYYLKNDIKMINQAINEGCKTDAPGSLVAWMCKNTIVYAMKMPGKRYDIGNLESYENVKKIYKGVEK